MATERPDPLAPPAGYGIKPGQQPEPVTSPVCLHNKGACQLPAVVRAVLGCVGEHIAELYFCAPHWAGISTTGQAWECRGPAGGRGCGNMMRLETVQMLTADAAGQVAAEIVKLRGRADTAVRAALAWANDGQPETGLDRVREAVRKARGGDPPAQAAGYG